MKKPRLVDVTRAVVKIAVGFFFFFFLVVFRVPRLEEANRESISLPRGTRDLVRSWKGLSTWFQFFHVGGKYLLTSLALSLTCAAVTNDMWLCAFPVTRGGSKRFQFDMFD